MLPSADSPVTIYEAARLNSPDEVSVAASGKVLSLARSLTERDVLLTLVSGEFSQLHLFIVERK